MFQIANTELEKMSKWFILNKLSLNIKKTNFMLFGSKAKNLSSSFCIIIDNIIIEQVVSTTFVGVVINQSLT